MQPKNRNNKGYLLFEMLYGMIIFVVVIALIFGIVDSSKRLLWIFQANSGIQGAETKLSIQARRDIRMSTDVVINPNGDSVEFTKDGERITYQMAYDPTGNYYYIERMVAGGGSMRLTNYVTSLGFSEDTSGKYSKLIISYETHHMTPFSKSDEFIVNRNKLVVARRNS